MILSSISSYPQEIIFPDSFKIDTLLFKEYEFPQDDGPNPYLVEYDSLTSDQKKEYDRLFTSKAMYFQTLIKNYTALKENPDEITEVEFLNIVVTEFFSETDLLNTVKRIHRENISNKAVNQYFLKWKNHSIWILGSDGNQSETEILIEFYKKKIGATPLFIE